MDEAGRTILRLRSEKRELERLLREMADAAYEVTCYPNDEQKRFKLMALVQKEFTERPKSDGWHCPVCNLITDRAGLPCPDCVADCGCLVGSHFWDCRKATNAERSTAILTLLDKYSDGEITLSRLGEILDQSSPVLRAVFVRAGKLMGSSE